jgi:hypothetical protein
MPDLAPPSTSAFPSDPSDLDRGELEAVYLQLRNNYKSLQLSRGYYRGHSQRQGEQIRELSLQQFHQTEQLAHKDQQLVHKDELLRELIERETRLKRDAYLMLEAVTDLMEQLEGAGDALSQGFGAYQLGKRRSAGGGSAGLLAAGASLPALMQGVLHFLNRWRLGKQRFARLMDQRDALKALLENRDG